MDSIPPSQPFETQTSFGQQGGGMPQGPPFNVRDVISYVQSIKEAFADQPEVYDEFMAVLKDFRAKRIDTQAVVERITILFQGHPALLQGFSVFIPADDRNASVATST